MDSPKKVKEEQKSENKEFKKLNKKIRVKQRKSDDDLDEIIISKGWPTGDRPGETEIIARGKGTGGRPFD
ncbi:MAG: hypothetical protein WAO52_15000 [Prolixibacteraceae bacterium]